MNNNLSSSSSSSLTPSRLPASSTLNSGTSNNNTNTTITVLSTNDLLFKILEFFPAAELRTFALINQTWNKVARDDILWLQHINRKLNERNEVVLPSLGSLTTSSLSLGTNDRMAPILPSIHRSSSSSSSTTTVLPPHKTILYPPHHRTVPLRIDASLGGTYPLFQLYPHLPYYWPTQIIPHYFNELSLNGHTLDGELVQSTTLTNGNTSSTTTTLPAVSTTTTSTTTTRNNTNDHKNTDNRSSTILSSRPSPIERTHYTPDKRKILSVRYIGQEEGDRAVVANAPFPHLYTAPKEKTKRRTFPFLWAPVCSTVPVLNDLSLVSASTATTLSTATTTIPPLSRTSSGTSTGTFRTASVASTLIPSGTNNDLSHNFRRVLGAYIVAYYEVSVLSYDPKLDTGTSKGISGSERVTGRHNDNWLHHEEKKACVAVGLATQNFPLSNRMPGWDVHSYGYHGDDGFKFHSSGVGKTYGPAFGAGDTIGCGIVYLGSRNGNGSSFHLTRHSPSLHHTESSSSDNDSVDRSLPLHRRRLRRQDAVEHDEERDSSSANRSATAAAPYLAWQKKSFDEAAHDWPREDGAILFYTLNGQLLGPAFTGICCHESWYPCVGIDSPHPIRFNFGGTHPFCFDIRSFNNALLADMIVFPIVLPNKFYIELMKQRRGKLTSDSGLTMAPLPPSTSSSSSSSSSTTVPSSALSPGNIFGGNFGSKVSSTNIFRLQGTTTGTADNHAELFTIVAKAMQNATLARLRISYLHAKVPQKSVLKRAITTDSDETDSSSSDDGDNDDRSLKRKNPNKGSGITSSRSAYDTKRASNTRSSSKYRRTTPGNDEEEKEQHARRGTNIPFPGVRSTATSTAHSRPPSRRNSGGMIGSIIVMDEITGPRTTNHNHPANPATTNPDDNNGNNSNNNARVPHRMVVQVNIPLPPHRSHNDNDDSEVDNDSDQNRGPLPFLFNPFDRPLSRSSHDRPETDRRDDGKDNDDKASTGSADERFSVAEYYPTDDPTVRPPRYQGRWQLRSHRPDLNGILMLFQQAMHQGGILPNLMGRMAARDANMNRGNRDHHNDGGERDVRSRAATSDDDDDDDDDDDEIDYGDAIDDYEIHDPIAAMFGANHGNDEDDDDGDNDDDNDDDDDDFGPAGLPFGMFPGRPNTRSADDNTDNDDGNNDTTMTGNHGQNNRRGGGLMLGGIVGPFLGPFLGPFGGPVGGRMGGGFDPFASLVLGPLMHMARMATANRDHDRRTNNDDDNDTEHAPERNESTDNDEDDHHDGDDDDDDDDDDDNDDTNPGRRMAEMFEHFLRHRHHRTNDDDDDDGIEEIPDDEFE